MRSRTGTARGWCQLTRCRRLEYAGSYRKPSVCVRMKLRRGRRLSSKRLSYTGVVETKRDSAKLAHHKNDMVRELGGVRSPERLVCDSPEAAGLR